MNDATRRQFLSATLGGAAAAASGTLRAEDPAQQSKAQPDRNASEQLDIQWHGDEVIGMLLYPGFTALDLFGPHHMFVLLMGAKVLLIAKDDNPVESDTKVKVSPTTTFAECPEKLTVLFVPGGTAGTLAAARDEATRTFVANRGAKADWVTSVCTGSLLLGAAGLLDGYKATSHWLVREELKAFGALPTDERVVFDRNRITGAGVTSGLDFALELVGKLRGKAYVQATQLFSECDPEPPFDAGNPKKSPAQLVDLLREMHGDFGAQVRKLATELATTKGK